MSVLESLQWRAAIKKFDTSKKVSNEDLEKLISATNLAPTSGGMQPFQLIVLSNKEIQDQLPPHSYGQMQVADASHVLIFAVRTDVDESIVDEFISRMANTHGQDESNYEGYRQSMKAYIGSMDQDTRLAWSRNQTYIALGTALAAAADLRIDSCPMEGFDPMEFKKLLGIEDKALLPAAILPIGYRSDEDVHSKSPKVRKSREELVIEVY